MITRPLRRLAALGLAAGLLTSVPALAPATPSPRGTVSAAARSTTLTDDVVLPFSLAVKGHRVYVAEGATSTVARIRGDGSLATVATGQQGAGADVAGLAFSRDGRHLAFTTTNADHSVATLEVLGPLGQRRSVDLAGFEASRNPDRVKSYGIDGADQCAIDAFEQLGVPASYTGEVDSHPYAVAAWGRHGWVVADAGGNNLLTVDRNGRVANLSVLPRQPLLLTAAIAQSLGLPDCVVGKTYNFEAVPTDVEVGADGWLYVTVLAGGPESPVLGARSKVYRVNPRTGTPHTIISGLLGATDLALGRHGEVFVTEFYAGTVTRIDFGRRSTVAELPGAVSIESTRHGLYVGTAAPFGEQGPEGTGTVVHLR